MGGDRGSEKNYAWTCPRCDLSKWNGVTNLFSHTKCRGCGAGRDGNAKGGVFLQSDVGNEIWVRPPTDASMLVTFSHDGVDVPVRTKQNKWNLPLPEPGKYTVVEVGPDTVRLSRHNVPSSAQATETTIGLAAQAKAWQAGRAARVEDAATPRPLPKKSQEYFNYRMGPLNLTHELLERGVYQLVTPVPWNAKQFAKVSSELGLDRAIRWIAKPSLGAEAGTGAAKTAQAAAKAAGKAAVAPRAAAKRAQAPAVTTAAHKKARRR